MGFAGADFVAGFGACGLGACGFGAVAGLAVDACAAVRAKTVDGRLDERRSVTCPRTSDSGLHRFVDGEHVDAVRVGRRNAVACCPAAQAASRLACGQRRLHRIEVVLTEKNQRQPFECREIQTLRTDTFFRRGIADQDLAWPAVRH